MLELNLDDRSESTLIVPRMEEGFLQTLINLLESADKGCNAHERLKDVTRVLGNSLSYHYYPDEFYKIKEHCNRLMKTSFETITILVDYYSAKSDEHTLNELNEIWRETITVLLSIANNGETFRDYFIKTSFGIILNAILNCEGLQFTTRKMICIAAKDHIIKLSVETKKLVLRENIVMIDKLAVWLIYCGDYETQEAVLEILLTLTVRNKKRVEYIKKWFVMYPQLNEYIEHLHRYKDTVEFARLLLVEINKNVQDKVKVYSVPCVKAFADKLELKIPKSDIYKDFWIDFSVKTGVTQIYFTGGEQKWSKINIHFASVKELISSNKKKIWKVKFELEQPIDIFINLRKKLFSSITLFFLNDSNLLEIQQNFFFVVYNFHENFIRALTLQWKSTTDWVRVQENYSKSDIIPSSLEQTSVEIKENLIEKRINQEVREISNLRAPSEVYKFFVEEQNSTPLKIVQNKSKITRKSLSLSKTMRKSKKRKDEQREEIITKSLLNNKENINNIRTYKQQKKSIYENERGNRDLNQNEIVCSELKSFKSKEYINDKVGEMKLCNVKDENITKTRGDRTFLGINSGKDDRKITAGEDKWINKSMETIQRNEESENLKDLSTRTQENMKTFCDSYNFKDTSMDNDHNCRDMFSKHDEILTKLGGGDNFISNKHVPFSFARDHVLRTYSRKKKLHIPNKSHSNNEIFDSIRNSNNNNNNKFSPTVTLSNRKLESKPATVREKRKLFTPNKEDSPIRKSVKNSIKKNLTDLKNRKNASKIYLYDSDESEIDNFESIQHRSIENYRSKSLRKIPRISYKEDTNFEDENCYNFNEKETSRVNRHCNTHVKKKNLKDSTEKIEHAFDMKKKYREKGCFEEKSVDQTIKRKDPHIFDYEESSDSTDFNGSLETTRAVSSNISNREKEISHNKVVEGTSSRNIYSSTPNNYTIRTPKGIIKQSKAGNIEHFPVFKDTFSAVSLSPIKCFGGNRSHTASTEICLNCKGYTSNSTRVQPTTLNKISSLRSNLPTIIENMLTDNMPTQISFIDENKQENIRKIMLGARSNLKERILAQMDNYPNFENKFKKTLNNIQQEVDNLKEICNNFKEIKQNVDYELEHQISNEEIDNFLKEIQAQNYTLHLKNDEIMSENGKMLVAKLNALINKYFNE